MVTISKQTPNAVKVLDVKHWSDRLFSFTVERPSSFRFRSGEFVMIGLLDKNSIPLLRAYSITSPNWDEKISFYSIKIKNGPLTSKLKKIKTGDFILMKTKPVGTLVLDALLPGKRIFLFSTGTGIAPFASLIRDPETYLKFEKVILTNTCRKKEDLSFAKEIIVKTINDPLVGEDARKKLFYFSSTTREKSEYMGRITNIILDKTFFKFMNEKYFNLKNDRIMICGSLEMNLNMKKIFVDLGFKEGSNSEPGQFVLEKAFVG